MRPTPLFVLYASSLFISGLACAADAVPSTNVIGKIGFGFGEKLTSRCAPITKKLAQSFDKCEYEKTEKSSYAQKNDYYTCDITKKGDQYVIYQSKERCTEELETMKANAP